MKFSLFFLIFVQLLSLEAVDLKLFCRQFESANNRAALAQFGINSDDFKSMCEYQLFGLNIKDSAFEACQASADYLLNHSLEVLKKRPQECFLFSRGCLEKEKYFEEYLYCVKSQAGLDQLADCPVNSSSSKKALLFDQARCLSSVWKSYKNPGISLENFCEEIDEKTMETEISYFKSTFTNFKNVVAQRVQFINSLGISLPELLKVAKTIENTLSDILLQNFEQKYGYLDHDDLPWFLCEKAGAHSLLKNILSQVNPDLKSLNLLKNLIQEYKEMLFELEQSKRIPKAKFKLWYPNLVLELSLDAKSR